MHIIREFAYGIFTVLKLTGAPMLYRYRFENSAYALRSDWKQIAGDIESVMRKMRDER